MQSDLNNMAILSTGGSGQPSAAATALVGLLKAAGSSSGHGASFGKELAGLLSTNGQTQPNTRAQLLTSASPAALTSVVADLKGNLSIAGKAANNAGPLTAKDIADGLAHLDPRLAAEIRGQILDAVNAGDIKLPPAWIKALKAGDQITPKAGEDTATPPVVRDILAALGFIAAAAPDQPVPVAKAIGNGPTGAQRAAAGAVFGAQAGTGYTPEGGSVDPAADKTKAKDGSAGAAGQTATDLTKSGHGGSRADQMVASVRERLDAAGQHGNRANTTGSANGQSQGQGQNNGGANSSGNQSGNGASQQFTAGQSGLAAHRADQTPSPDSKGQAFLARLETTLQARGLTLASVIPNGAGDRQPDDGSTLTQQGVTPIGQPFSAAASSASTPATTQAPAFTGWMPVAGQVAMQLTRMVKDGNQQFTIRLDPPELGRVDVKLKIDHDGKVNAMVSVDHQKALHLLQRDQGLLERALADAGLKADSGSLNFSLNQHGDTGHQQADGSASSVTAPAAPIEGLPDNLATTTASLTVSDRALDIKV